MCHSGPSDPRPFRPSTVVGGETDPSPPHSVDKVDKMVCERCGAEMYRMHAVWRCSACGFKTDCCGW